MDLFEFRYLILQELVIVSNFWIFFFPSLEIIVMHICDFIEYLNISNGRVFSAHQKTFTLIFSEELCDEVFETLVHGGSSLI